jgi:hypothetical protein
MAEEVATLKKQMSDLTSRMAVPSGFIKYEHSTDVHVKAEVNAMTDLVSSSEEESPDDGSGTDTLHNKELSGTPHNKELRESQLENKAVRVRIRTARTTLRTPSYTKGKQRRDCSLKNWEYGMKRNAKVERINEEIAEATAENLPKILEFMRVSGFGIIRNFKKLIHRTALPMDVDSSDDEESASAPRYTSVFKEGNEPDATQAEFAHTPGWNVNGSAKTPKHDLLFEGVIINSKDYEFKTRMSRPEPHDVSGRQPRQSMTPKTKALDAYNERYIGQMRDILQGMFANEIQKPGCDPANPFNWHMSQNVVWG